MSIRLRRLCDVSKAERAILEERLRDYYTSPPGSYYLMADYPVDQYRPDLVPFHCDLIERIKPGMTVLELGCGTAHLCPHVEAAGGHYTGADYSSELLKSNRAKFPQARFVSLDEEISQRFDVVASLYTIEHIVEPVAYLERLWRFCKSGGLVAIICPEAIDNDALPPSLYYGTTSRRLREKLATFALKDVFCHTVDLFRARRWKTRARHSPPGAFWINLRPRVLAGADYSIDADAVHLPRLRDLVWWFQGRLGTVVVTSQSLGNIDPNILRYNCYLVARKEVVATTDKR